MSQSIILEHDWFPETVPGNVTMGPNSWLYSSFAFLHFKSERDVSVKIGASCGIYNGTFFELGPEGCVEVGDYTTLVGVIFSTNKRVSIGRYCFMAHEVVIADEQAMTPPDCHIKGEQNSSTSSADIVIGDNVWIGAGVTILGGAKIGTGAVIGAGAVIDSEIPAMTIAAGNPARIVGTVPR